MIKFSHGERIAFAQFIQASPSTIYSWGKLEKWNHKQTLLYRLWRQEMQSEQAPSVVNDEHPNNIHLHIYVHNV